MSAKCRHNCAAVRLAFTVFAQPLTLTLTFEALKTGASVTPAVENVRIDFFSFSS